MARKRVYLLWPEQTLSTDEFLATAAFGGANRGALLTPAGATLVEAVAATSEVTASPADVTIADGVTGVTDTLLAADGSRFLQLTSAFSASSSGDGASGSSNDSTNNSSSAFGSPGVTQALCKLKPAASLTSNESQQAQQQQQQSPRQLSLSFFARASLCAEGEGGAEGEAERLLRVLLLAVPLNASAAATAGGDAAAGGGAGEGGAREQVWAEWRVGVPCGGSSASLSGALPWFHVGPLLFPLPDLPDSSSSSSTASPPSSLVVPPGGVTLHLVIRGVQDSNSTSGTATVTTTSGIATAKSSIAASGSESSSIGATSATIAASTEGGAGEGAGVKAAAVKRVDVASEAGGGAGAGSTAIDLASVMPTRSESERQKWLAGSQVCHRYSWLKACAAHMLNSHSSASSISHCTSTHNPTSRSPPPSLPPHSPSLSLPCSRPLPSQVLLPMALQHPRLTHSPSLPHPSSPPLPPFPPTPHPCHCPAADPSPLKSFSHWPLSSAHPLITAGSARRNSSSLSLTSLSDFNSASLALHPAPFALLAPATPASPCRPFSFSTSFTFRISSPNAAGLGGEGLAFVMLPTPTLGLPGPSLGYGRVLLPPGSTAGADNSTAQDRSLAVECDTSKSLKHFSLPSLYHPQQHRSLAVEFDTSASLEFWDRPDHHVGVNLHGSMLSLASAPVHPLGIPALNAGQTLLATIHYNASSSHLTWLGGNDPDAVSPPPPLLVGFTAATGKGTEQAQAHENTAATGKGAEQAQAHEATQKEPTFLPQSHGLHHSLRLRAFLHAYPNPLLSSPRPACPHPHSMPNPAAEDPLPFWAAHSFSFPYITPATPLLTRGSTRKRFFAADLSVAADVASSSGQSDDPAPGAIYFPRHTDPCKGSPVLPCGTGACTKARAPWDPSILVPSCKCPLKLPSFQPSHLSGLPSCFPGETWSVVGKRWSAVGTRWGAVGKRWSAVGERWSAVGERWSAVDERWSAVDSFTCRQFPRNPCAPGVCIDDVDGTYSCLCPSPFFPFYFYPKGAARCYQLRLAETRMPTFLSPYGLTCALILNTYGLTQADFFAQNKYDSSPNALLSLSLPLTHLFPCRSLTSFPAAHSPLSLPLTHLFHLSPCHSLTSFPATHSPLSLPLTHLFPRDSLTSFPATHSPLSPRLTHLFPRDSLTSFPATHSPLSPRLTHLFPRNSLTSFPATHSPLSPRLTRLFGDTCDSLNALFSTQIQPLNPALTCSDGPRPGQILRNGSVFTHSYSLSLPTPPFSSISSFSSPLPPSPRFLHTFISPLSPIFLLSLSPPSPPFASLSPFLLPLPLSPPSLPFSPLSPLSPSLPFSSLPPSQLLCVAFNQTWLGEDKTRISCKLQAQITPAVSTTTPSTALNHPRVLPPPSFPAPLRQLQPDVARGGKNPHIMQAPGPNHPSRPQSCQQLWRAFGVASPSRFFQMNQGLSCDALLPYSPLQGNMMTRVSWVACVRWVGGQVGRRAVFAIAFPTRFFQMNPGLSCDSLLPHSPLQGNMMSRTLVEDREASRSNIRRLEDDLARERAAREDKEMEVHALSARLADAEEALAQRKEEMRKVWEAIPEAVRHLPSEEDMQIISLHPETTEITLNDPSHLTLFGFLHLSCMRSLKSISVIGNLEKPALLHLYSMTWLEELRLESMA
ncbi:unnamed protein product [Closterium sp. NIES-65]|nr:unnamed protein product [Closterium sp. NIES-65]